MNTAISQRARRERTATVDRGATARVQRAIQLVLHSLSRLPRNEAVQRLVNEAERLLADVEGWRDSPPSPEVRDRTMRAALSIHPDALRSLSASPPK